jgi:hypothetical protein
MRSTLINLSFTTTDELLEKLEEILEDLSDLDKIAVELAQVQRAGLRRHAVTQVGTNRFRFETHEASNAFRGMLIEVAFPGPDALGHFEVTSEFHIIPTADPWPECYGQECQDLGMV